MRYNYNVSNWKRNIVWLARIILKAHLSIKHFVNEFSLCFFLSTNLDRVNSIRISKSSGTFAFYRVFSTYLFHCKLKLLQAHYVTCFFLLLLPTAIFGMLSIEKNANLKCFPAKFTFIQSTHIHHTIATTLFLE